MAPVPISLRQISKSYGSFRALDAVDLEIAAGEFMTLLGPSGSGKTTLLNVIAGFVRPDRGHVSVAGEEITRMPPHKRDLAMVFQNYALFPHMSVAENVAYPLRMRRVGRAEIDSKVAAALDLVRLGHTADRRPEQLSGGQKQRIALARAVSFEPRILLMDEPLSALDKKLREEMQLEIRALHDRLGITTVYVTHDQREALTMSDRVAVINEGRIVQLDGPRELYEQPRSLFVADFIGESTHIHLTRDGDALTLGGQPLALDAPGPGDAVLVVRPEKLRLVDGDANGRVVFDTTVESRLFQGESVLLQLRLADGQAITWRQAATHEEMAVLPRKGGVARLGLSPADAIVLPADAP